MKTSQRKLDDIHYCMETVLLEASIQEDREISDYSITHLTKVSYLVDNKTGRGIHRLFHKDFK